MNRLESIQSVTPPGLEMLYSFCRELYPNQPNPLQVTALVKYWLGGPDPLDYVSMYAHPGSPDLDIPPHWHYVSFGLSDLHGDGRVHPIPPPPPGSGLSSSGPSGFGFELTMRLKRESGETAPPTWPATLMQALAKYVFGSGNALYPGDHVSWHMSLDGSESRIQHMLLASDPVLASQGPRNTPHGPVNFVQIVGVCLEELKLSQRWNGLGVLALLSRAPGCGGPWLLTDMRRGESLLELDASAEEQVECGIAREGSDLSGVSARLCRWRGNNEEEEEDPGVASDTQRAISQLTITLDPEAAGLLPLAIRGRVLHGRHFTFKTALGDAAITLVAPQVTGTIVSPQEPYVALGPWLQVLLPEEFGRKVAESITLATGDASLPPAPETFSWPDHKLTLVILEANKPYL